MNSGNLSVVIKAKAVSGNIESEYVIPVTT